MKRGQWLQLLIAVVLSTSGLVLPKVLAGPSGTVSGQVVDAIGPVSGAVVRQQTTTNSTITASDGSFTLSGLKEGASVIITAWFEGYHPGGVEVVPPQTGVTITLKAHPLGDNPDHKWLTSLPDPENAIGCGHCMVSFPQWVENAHAQSGVNQRFFTMYNGTDLSGTQRVGPGYKNDFPGTAGNCANCHAPGKAANQPFTADMNDLTGVETEGVFCDFCHKVASVYLNPATGLPYSNVPGVQSMQLNRPPADTHMFYGPFDDVTRRVSYLELEKKSQFCAPCHQFSFWGTPIYESFREWLESPYPAMGVECQTCHMEPTGVDYFVFSEDGGLIRDPQLIASHLQPGAADIELLQNTVRMRLFVRWKMDQIKVTVAITNSSAGHHVPTDFPGRNMLLVVQGKDEQEAALPQIGGPKVPEWGGDLAGLAGKGFAKVLRDVITGEAPVINYWKQTLIDSDNRIPAKATDISTYIFAAPIRGQAVTISVELRFCRLFKDILEAKGWKTPDILMEQQKVVVFTLPGL